MNESKKKFVGKEFVPTSPQSNRSTSVTRPSELVVTPGHFAKSSWFLSHFFFVHLSPPEAVFYQKFFVAVCHFTETTCLHLKLLHPVTTILPALSVVACISFALFLSF